MGGWAASKATAQTSTDFKKKKKKLETASSAGDMNSVASWN